MVAKVAKLFLSYWLISVFELLAPCLEGAVVYVDADFLTTSTELLRGFYGSTTLVLASKSVLLKNFDF